MELEVKPMLEVISHSAEFEAYAHLLHVHHSPVHGAHGAIVVVLQYEATRYLTEFVEFDWVVLQATGDPAIQLCERIAKAFRRLIVRAHAGHYIPPTELYTELRENLRAAEEAFADEANQEA